MTTEQGGLGLGPPFLCPARDSPTQHLVSVALCDREYGHVTNAFHGKDTVICGRAEPREGRFGGAVDGTHHLHLAVSLVDVALVDAHGVRPHQLPRPHMVGPIPPEKCRQIPGDLKLESVDMYGFCVGGIPPHI